ncbi:MAG TPA: MarR family transcriptional regulator [Nitrosopumilaceae archaeon]|nr:MarR family transcriptional regulator [Nitrosopumilaceae archaeon]
MAGTKKVSPSNQKKVSPSGQKDGKKSKKEKGESGPKKAEITVLLNEQEATKIIQRSKVITTHDLARQTGVKVSAANVFLKESLKKGIIKRVGGFSGHYIYQPVSS